MRLLMVAGCCVRSERGKYFISSSRSNLGLDPVTQFVTGIVMPGKVYYCASRLMSHLSYLGQLEEAELL